MCTKANNITMCSDTQAPRVEEFLVPVQDFKKPVTITQLLEMVGTLSKSIL